MRKIKMRRTRSRRMMRSMTTKTHPMVTLLKANRMMKVPVVMMLKTAMMTGK